MRKLLLIVLVVAAITGSFFYYNRLPTGEIELLPSANFLRGCACVKIVNHTSRFLRHVDLSVSDVQVNGGAPMHFAVGTLDKGEGKTIDVTKGVRTSHDRNAVWRIAVAYTAKAGFSDVTGMKEFPMKYSPFYSSPELMDGP